MVKIRIKKEDNEIGISLVFKKPKIKEKFSGIVSGASRVFRAIRQYFYLRFRLFRIIFIVLKANPQTVFLAADEQDNRFSLSWEANPNRARSNFELPSFGRTKTVIRKINSTVSAIFYVGARLTKRIGEKINNKKEKLTKTIAALTIFVLLLQASMVGTFLVFPSFASADDNLCVVDVDVVLIMDTSGSMGDGEAPSNCEWEELEWVGPSKQCVSYEEDGLTEGECLAKPDPVQCDSPVYTEPTQSKMDDAKDAAESFIDNLESNDQSAMVFFSNNASLVKTLSNDHAATKATMDGIVLGGGTNIGDAIAEGTAELGSERANSQATKAMVLLTDGKANKPSGDEDDDAYYAEQKAEEAGALGYKIFTIGLGGNSDINEEMLQNIADTTGAQYYNASNGSDLSDIYDEIAWEICQYGSISGCKYADLDNDGDIEDEETLSDWEIVLSGDAEASQLTDEDGCYTFAGLPPGSYTVSETQQEGWMQTYPQEPETYDVILNDWNQHVDGYDFANYLLPICGNSIIEEGEQCDDGNTEDGDNCSAICEIEEAPGPEDILTEQECTEADYYWYDDACHGEPEPEESEDIQPGSLVINEIMQNPKAVGDSKGEWFELYNTTGTDIDLEGCTIRDNNSNSHTITDSLVVPSQDYAVLVRNDDSTKNGGIENAYEYSSFRLDNDDDEIVLKCNDTEIDIVEYDGGPEFPNPNGASMILADPILDNNIGSNWCESTSPFGPGDPPDLGTPGAENDECVGIPIPEPEPEPYCGDGILDEDQGEQCDDGNNIDGDGCSLSCQLELPEDIISEDACENFEYYWYDDACHEDPEPEPEPEEDTTISGCKYNDLNNNGQIDEGEETLGGWTIVLEQQNNGDWEQTASTITPQDGESQGCYVFDNLDPGNYRVSESITDQTGWIQTFPDTLSYIVTLDEDEALSDLDFANYLSCTDNDEDGYAVEGGDCGPVDSDDDNPDVNPGADEICDNNIDDDSDGDIDGDDEDCQAAPSPAGGGVGGPGPTRLTIFGEGSSEVLTDTVTVTWSTSTWSTSRVVYDTISHPELGDPPNYGYAFSTDEDVRRTLSHTVTITGLTPGTTYYWRGISHSSPEILSDEMTFTTGLVQGESTVGEEEEGGEEEEEVAGPSPAPAPECTPEETQLCDTGVPGICSGGTQICSQEGFWGTCVVNEDNVPVLEACSNELDDDCDGYIDEPDCGGIVEIVCTDYYNDSDADGYGVTGDSLCLAEPSGTYTGIQGGDCDDTKAEINPAAIEICDNQIDDNCNKDIDCEDEECVEDEVCVGVGEEEEIIAGEESKTGLAAFLAAIGDTFGRGIGLGIANLWWILLFAAAILSILVALLGRKRKQGL